jgi:uncharacterized protein YndB with AHSA1/START domain
MSTLTELPAGEAVILMNRVFDAPRDLVWEATTDPRHVKQWWGGAGARNPVCEMDVRSGGAWHHVLVFPNGQEITMNFVFVEVEKPKRLVFQDRDHGARRDGPPTARFTVTLEEEDGGKTRWRMVARFTTVAARDAVVTQGFTGPIAASNERLAEYLTTM